MRLSQSGDRPSVCEESDTEEEQARYDQLKDESTQSARPASLGLGVFSWSGKPRELSQATSHPPSITDRPVSKPTPSGLSTLQQFQRKNSSFSWKGSGKRSLSSSPLEGTKDLETSPDSPPSQDSAYFSQSSNTSNVEELSSCPVAADTVERVRKCPCLCLIYFIFIDNFCLLISRAGK